MARKAPWGPLARSSPGGAGPSRARPLSSTSTWSLSRMVLIRWATTSSVHPRKAAPFFIVACRAASAARSTDAVASSKSTTFLLWSAARAMERSCRCPALQLAPPSITHISSPSPEQVTNSLRRATSRADHTSSSVFSSAGSRLNLRGPEKRWGSWGMIASALRSWGRATLAVSTPSMSTCPPHTSLRRARARSSEDLPEPVRPTTPSLEPPNTRQSTPCKTQGKSDR
mmetsp:Transcript_70178/g.158705  ORF Transcript_70178/g.158705 Transcript_70178/m.158705 type:complete len:228 (-) Transcript_70178:156-839(-)